MSSPRYSLAPTPAHHILSKVDGAAIVPKTAHFCSLQLGATMCDEGTWAASRRSGGMLCLNVHVSPDALVLDNYNRLPTDANDIADYVTGLLDPERRGGVTTSFISPRRDAPDAFPAFACEASLRSLANLS